MKAIFRKSVVAGCAVMLVAGFSGCNDEHKGSDTMGNVAND